MLNKALSREFKIKYNALQTSSGLAVPKKDSLFAPLN